MIKILKIYQLPTPAAQIYLDLEFDLLEETIAGEQFIAGCFSFLLTHLIKDSGQASHKKG